jgi:hypothetical protein
MSEQLAAQAQRRLWTHLALIFLVALGGRLLFVLSRYTPSLSNFEFGDYPSYAFAARHWLQHGDFSSRLFLVRPPLFPLLIALLGDQTAAVLLANCALGALNAVLAALLCEAAFGRRAEGRFGLLAGLFVALDPSSVAYSAFLGAEPLANASLTLTLLCFWQALNAAARPAICLRRLILAALALSVSMLTRPLAYLLWLPLGLLGAFALRHKQRLWAGVTAFALISGGTMSAWIAHNGRVFDNATFSSTTYYTMLYYRAASIEHLATGAAPEEVLTALSLRVEARLGRTLPPEIAPEGVRHTHLANTAEEAAALLATALEVFLTYPHIYLVTLPLGLVRMYSHTQIINGAWRIVDVLWNILLTGLFLYGLALLWRERQQRLFALFTTLIALYFTVSTLLVKTAGIDTRERSMLVSLMACCAAYAVHAIAQRLGRRAKAERAAYETAD